MSKKKKTKLIAIPVEKPEMETVEVIQVINENAYNGHVILKMTCKICGGIHTMSEEKKDPHTVKNCVEKWKTLSGFIVTQSCTFCATDKTMTLTINDLTVPEFWQWVWSDILKKVKVPLNNLTRGSLIGNNDNIKKLN